MRPNNWEYALDQSCLSYSAFYAYEAGSSYLSLWEYGLGVSADQSYDERFTGQIHLKPLAPNLVATQLGVYYELCPDALW